MFTDDDHKFCKANAHLHTSHLKIKQMANDGNTFNDSLLQNYINENKNNVQQALLVPSTRLKTGEPSRERKEKKRGWEEAGGVPHFRIRIP